MCSGWVPVWLALGTMLRVPLAEVRLQNTRLQIDSVYCKTLHVFVIIANICQLKAGNGKGELWLKTTRGRRTVHPGQGDLRP